MLRLLCIRYTVVHTTLLNRLPYSELCHRCLRLLLRARTELYAHQNPFELIKVVFVEPHLALKRRFTSAFVPDLVGEVNWASDRGYLAIQGIPRQR